VTAISDDSIAAAFGRARGDVMLPPHEDSTAAGEATHLAGLSPKVHARALVCIIG
jgi:hypothetical protein